MMLNVDAKDREKVLNYQAASVELTNEELFILQSWYSANSELVEGKTAAQVLRLLCEPYSEVNDEPITLVERTEWKTDVLLNVLLKMKLPNNVPFFVALEMLKLDADPSKAALAIMVDRTVNSSLEAVVITDPDVAAAIQGLQNENLLTPEQVEAITMMPDPDWTETVIRPPRIEQLLGVTGACLSAQEIEQVMAV